MQNTLSFPGSLLALTLTAVAAAAQGPPPTLVATAPVEELEFHDQLTLVGRTEARSESRIVAEVAGRVSSVDAPEGRRTKRGEALVTIDCQRAGLQLEAKRAEAAQAKAQAELAAKEKARAEELVSTDVYPQRNLDTARANAESAAERHRQLDAESRRLELDLEDCTIAAPYDGFTIRKLVDVGEWVDAGTPVYEMVDLSVVKVTVDLPERRFGHVELGSTATVTLSGEGEPIEGRVTGIAPRASETTHTFPVLITLPNQDGRVGSGMLVKATLNLSETFQGLAVSKDAIVRQDERTLVYTVAGGQAVPVPVRVLATSGEKVAVEAEGLRPGQPVVVRGNERIFPGSPVRTGEEGAPAPGG